MKNLLVIVGPTAVGKTALSIKLALELGTEIVSADSRQIFKEMQIGTAKPTFNELNQVKHHFIDSHSINENYTAGNYEKEALKCLEELFKIKDVVILTGGSGLYVKAVTEGMANIPAVDPAIREKLEYRLNKEGLEILIGELKKMDPEYYGLVDLNNPRRILRAMEVYLGTGMKYSRLRYQSGKGRTFKVIKLGLNRSREDLYERINARMDTMISQGLFEEAKRLYTYRDKQALQTVGYKEIINFFDGKYDRTEAVRLLKRNTRRYAKRQLTWFRGDGEIQWFHPDEYGKLINYVRKMI